jgi:hypothetical protein
LLTDLCSLRLCSSTAYPTFNFSVKDTNPIYVSLPLSPPYLPMPPQTDIRVIFSLLQFYCPYVMTSSLSAPAGSSFSDRWSFPSFSQFDIATNVTHCGSGMVGVINVRLLPPHFTFSIPMLTSFRSPIRSTTRLKATWRSELVPCVFNLSSSS